MDKVLIAHGAWFQSDGQPKDGREAIIPIPQGLTICIYNVQGTPLSVESGLVFLNHILRGDMPALQHGQNTVEGIPVEYKEFRFGTQSSYISNYLIQGDPRNFTGLYEVGNSTPLIPMDENYQAYLEDILNNPVMRETKRLHLLCCQVFH